MISLHRKLANVRPFIVPVALLVFASAFAFVQTTPAFASWTVNFTPGPVFYWDVDPAVWSGPAGNCSFVPCSAPNHIGNSCYSNKPTPGWTIQCEPGNPGNCGNLVTQWFTCTGTCTPDYSCAASTCTGDTCSDTCGGLVAGTKNCQVCSPLKDKSCTKSNACNSTSGTYDCFANCSAAEPAPPPSNFGQSCTATNACNQSNLGTYGCSGTCSAVAPALPARYGQTCKSAKNACGVQGDGVYDCTDTCNAVVPALNPAVNITATPTRVNAGDKVSISVTGSDLDPATNCTVTGTDGLNDTFKPPGSCSPNKNYNNRTINSQTTYTVTCGPATAKVIVNVNPKFVPF